VIKLIFGKKKRRKEEDLPVMLPQAQAEPLGQTVDIIEEVYQKFEVKENQKEKQLKEYAEEHPEIAADLIKAWMKE